MNIIFFIHNLNSGGIENYLLRFLKTNHNEFDNIYVWCKSRNKGDQLEKYFLKLPNVEIIKEPMGYFNFWKYRNLAQFMKSKHIDATCDFTGNFGGLAMLTSYMVGVKKRIVFYRSSSDHFKKNLFKLFYNSFVNYLTKIFSTDILANSKTGLNYFFGSGWEKNQKYEVIYNDVNVDSFLGEKSNLRDEFNISIDAFIVGHTGRFNEAKNHSTIIKVAEKLIEQHKNIFFILCGNGVKINLEPIVTDKNLANRVLLFENRSDIPKFLNTMDCFYFPSITEGQPNALIEAMVKGLPIVTSNIAPIKETVPLTHHGQLTNPMDIDAAVEKIKGIMNNNNRKNAFLDLQETTLTKYGQGNNFNKFLRRITK